MGLIKKMRLEIVLYITVGLLIGIVCGFYFDKVITQTKQNNFTPPDLYTSVSEIETSAGTITPKSSTQNFYTNKNLGINITIPNHTNSLNEKAELLKDNPEAWNGIERDAYKYYQIVIYNENNPDIKIEITAEETNQQTILDWITQDVTSQKYFSEQITKLETKRMFDSDVLFGTTNDYNMKLEELFIIENGLLYNIKLSNLTDEENTQFWKNLNFNNRIPD